jgi:hypothetical protein
LAPADHGRRELRLLLQGQPAAAARAAQRPTLNLPAQVDGKREEGKEEPKKSTKCQTEEMPTAKEEFLSVYSVI